ncbi:MAG: stage II sporulation protein D [Oscillospiraceae bacterium]|jgi:stage II sporulation protein D|nr:stage II sporulation protein D [Oscillospiraceae bacterium]
MKRRTLFAAGIALLCFVIPMILPYGAASVADAPEEIPPETPPMQVKIVQPKPAAQELPFDEELTIPVKLESGVEELSLREYLVGVVLAEMPASFSAEALKAQAVASRTFTLRKIDAEKHEDAGVCGNSSCCQGYISPTAYVQGAGSQENVEAVRMAVEATDGLVVTYNNALIDATYFSCSGGRTEAAVAVWGGDIPYLQAVDSPGEEDALRYTETLEIDAREFAATLLASYPEMDLGASPADWFGATSYTAGGGIDCISIGGVEVSGTALRSLFSLRSTNLILTPEQDSIIIKSFGFGHRVGMSQYGADAMARSGKDFEEILTHYYQGTKIQKLLRNAQ